MQTQLAVALFPSQDIKESSGTKATHLIGQAPAEPKGLSFSEKLFETLTTAAQTS